MKTRQTSPRSILLALTLLLGAALTTAAIAQPGSEPPPPGGAPTELAGHRMGGPGMMQRHGGDPGAMMGQMLLRPEARQRLNLTDQQVQQIQQLDTNAQKQFIDLDAQIQKAEIDLRQLLTQPRPDRQQVLNQVDAVAQARVAKAKAEVAHHLDLRQVLNDEQLKTIQQHLQSAAGRPFMERMNQRFGHGAPGQKGGPDFDREALRERWQQRQQQQQPGQPGAQGPRFGRGGQPGQFGPGQGGQQPDAGQAGQPEQPVPPQQ